MKVQLLETYKNQHIMPNFQCGQILRTCFSMHEKYACMRIFLMLVFNLKIFSSILIKVYLLSLKEYNLLTQVKILT